MNLDACYLEWVQDTQRVGNSLHRPQGRKNLLWYSWGGQNISQIKAILGKYGVDDDLFGYQNNNIGIGGKDDTNIDCVPISTKAYKLFSEGETSL